MFVNNLTDIMKNILTLEKYRVSENCRESDYYKKIVRRGKVFVVVKINGALLFAPSKFVGYLENNMEKHEIDKNYKRDGRETNREIDNFLGKHEMNGVMETEFLRFCKQNFIVPADNKRTYWKIQDISNLNDSISQELRQIILIKR